MHPSTAFAAAAPRRRARRHRRHRAPGLLPALVLLLTSTACAVVLGSISFAVGGA